MPACLLTNNKTSVFFILVNVSSANYRLSLPPCVLAVGQRAVLIRQTSGQEMAASSCEIDDYEAGDIIFSDNCW